MKGDRSFMEDRGCYFPDRLPEQNLSQRSRGYNDQISRFWPASLPDSGQNASARRIVALTFASDSLPAKLISEQLARSIHEETQGSVVLVRFESRPDQSMTKTGTQSNPSLNGEFHMPSHVNRTEAGFHTLTLSIHAEPPSPEGIESLLSQLSGRFRHVLLEVPACEHSSAWVVECLVRSDLAYLCLQADPRDVSGVSRVMQNVRTRCRNGGVHLKPVVCLAEDQSTQGLDLLLQPLASPIHLQIRGCPTVRPGEIVSGSCPSGFFRADVRRLARQVGGLLVGLALSSGAAKGFAHIGVIQVLEEHGIEVDVVAGSSMGAYVGSLWAHGNDGAALERLARELERRWALWTLIDPVFPPRQGLIRGFAVKKRLMRTLGHARFTDMVRPLRIVASNLATLERVVFSTGEVASAVHASSAVPGICVPVTLSGETYIDGGIVDPLPVDVLREMGVSRVIAVDVIPTPDRICRGLHAGREPARTDETAVHRVFRSVRPVNQQLNYFARGNLFEILMRSIYAAQIRVAEASCRMADVVLRPNICDDRWVDYRHPGKFITPGREVAERQIEEIKALVTRKETDYERNPASAAVAAVA